MTLATWPSAVRWEITSSSAISLFDRPRATSSATCCSRLDSAVRDGWCAMLARPAGARPSANSHGLLQRSSRNPSSYAVRNAVLADGLDELSCVEHS